MVGLLSFFAKIARKVGVTGPIAGLALLFQAIVVGVLSYMLYISVGDQAKEQEIRSIIEQLIGPDPGH
jgi:hypothetical protein